MQQVGPEGAEEHEDQVGLKILLPAGPLGQKK